MCQVSRRSLPNHQKHTFTHTKNMRRYVTVIEQKSTTICIENPRVGGSIPPPGTTFTKENSGLDRRKTPYACVNQKHTKHTLFAVF